VAALARIRKSWALTFLPDQKIDGEKDQQKKDNGSDAYRRLCGDRHANDNQSNLDVDLLCADWRRRIRRR
jgi:hypothetical protein